MHYVFWQSAPQQHIEYTLTARQLMRYKMLSPWHIKHSESNCILDYAYMWSVFKKWNTKC